jgi:formate hydrogenlyase subunit 4
MRILLIANQWFLFLVAAPLLSGLITKLKNNIRMRKGPGVFQPYWNLAKLFSKDEVVPRTSSWIFKATPFIVMASALTAALLVPVCPGATALPAAGDFLALIFILALGRFFLALAALDAGSAFGGMGSSREMFISSLVEPVVCLVIWTLSLSYGSTNLAAITGARCLSAASLIAALALFLVVLAETSRVPVDNQETHLELTMIHEAMVLEYSGRSLALLEMASYVKQMIWFFLIAQIIFPIGAPASVGIGDSVGWFIWYAGRLAVIAAAVAFVEVALAKMRLFRAADYLGFAFVLAVLAAVSGILGV